MAVGRLAQAIDNGNFIVTAECIPPRGSGTDFLKACASKLGSTVDAVCAPESEDGVRMSSLAACSHISASGAEPVLHLLTRDLNRIALQSTIIGAASLGIKNILCLVGRHQALTTSGAARGVFDVDPMQLLQVASSIRGDGMLADGSKLDAPLDLTLGSYINPFSDPMELQILVLTKCIRSGADFIMTAPVFNLPKFEKWMHMAREKNAPSGTAIIASVMPLQSAEHAKDLMSKYHHIDIPDEIINNLNASSTPKELGIEIAKRTVDALRKIEGVRGVHLMTGEDPDLALEIISSSGISRS